MHKCIRRPLHSPHFAVPISLSKRPVGDSLVEVLSRHLICCLVHSDDHFQFTVVFWKNFEDTNFESEWTRLHRWQACLGTAKNWCDVNFNCSQWGFVKSSLMNMSLVFVLKANVSWNLSNLSSTWKKSGASCPQMIILYNNTVRRVYLMTLSVTALNNEMSLSVLGYTAKWSVLWKWWQWR